MTKSAKISVSIPVTITVTAKDLRYVAELVYEQLDEEYGSDNVLLSGVVKRELEDALILDPEFQKLVVKTVKSGGTDALDEAYNYFEPLEIIHKVPALRALASHVEAMSTFFDEECVPTASPELMEMARQAGFYLTALK